MCVIPWGWLGNTETMKITRKAGHDDLEGDEVMNLDRSFDFQSRQNLTLLLCPSFFSLYVINRWPNLKRRLRRRERERGVSEYREFWRSEGVRCWYLYLWRRSGTWKASGCHVIKVMLIEKITRGETYNTSWRLLNGIGSLEEEKKVSFKWLKKKNKVSFKFYFLFFLFGIVIMFLSFIWNITHFTKYRF